MKRVILSVYLPAAQQSFDVQVPANVRFSQVLDLTAKALAGLCGGSYAVGEVPVLCDRETGEMFNINMTAWELGLRNGSQVMLI